MAALVEKVETSAEAAAEGPELVELLATYKGRGASTAAVTSPSTSGVRPAAAAAAAGGGNSMAAAAAAAGSFSSLNMQATNDVNDGDEEAAEAAKSKRGRPKGSKNAKKPKKK
jgi:hypothetical protein